MNGFNRMGAQGFTIIELMIVVVIIGIIASIAYPNYRDYQFKSRRSDGKTFLMGAAARQEQYFLDNKSYTANLSNLGYTANADTFFYSEKGYYKITATGTSLAFTLTATPSGVQAGDSCGNLTLNESAVRGQSGTGSNCW
jgi:type IV pilus assembly protein PilE